jgi:hypothetical protein
MSKSALSVRVFSVYLLVLGAGLLVVPNAVLAPLALPPTNEVWIRVVGVLAVVIGFYYLQASRRDLREFFALTVGGRVIVAVLFVGLALLRFGPPMLFLFAAVDASAALWTYLALRADTA